jgi:hypothetical protein
MFLVPEGEKLAFHHAQNQSGEGIFNPFLFHQAKPPSIRRRDFQSLCFIKPSPREKGILNSSSSTDH